MGAHLRSELTLKLSCMPIGSLIDHPQPQTELPKSNSSLSSNALNFNNVSLILFTHSKELFLKLLLIEGVDNDDCGDDE